MQAVIKTGGKQYIIKVGDSLKIEKIEGEVGSNVEFSEVLLSFDENGEAVKIGTPIIEGAKVLATIEEQGVGKKVSVVKYKPKVRYSKVVGHRQMFTKVKINEIQA